MARPKRKADCHPDRPHWAKGLCRKCYNRKWSMENRDKTLRYSREWRANNPEWNREIYSAWHKRNLVRNRISNNKYVSKKNNLPFTLTEQDWQEILDCWDYRCAYCGEHTLKLDQEHVTPVCQGGGYTIENIVPACGSCNSKKGGRTPIEAGMSFYYQNVY